MRFLTLVIVLLSIVFSKGMALNIPTAKKNGVTDSMSYLQKGYFYQFRDFKKSEYFFQEGIRISSGLKDTLSLVRLHFYFARYYQFRDYRMAAADHAQRALRLIEKSRVNNSIEKLWITIFLDLNHFVDPHRATPFLYKDTATVLKYIEIIDRYQKAGEFFFSAEACVDLAKYTEQYSAFGSLLNGLPFEESFLYLEQAKKMYLEIKYPDGLIHAAWEDAIKKYYACLWGYKPEKYCDQHRNVVSKLYKEAVAHNNLFYIARANNYFAYQELASSKPIRALPYIEKACAIAKQMGDQNQLIRYLFTYRDIYDTLKDFKKAYHYSDLLMRAKDSMYQVNSAEQLAYLKNFHENEMRDEQIKSLSFQNELKEKKIQQVTLITQIKDLTISQSNIKLVFLSSLSAVTIIICLLLWNRFRIKQKANIKMELSHAEIVNMVKEKEVLLQELHHRTKNNLQLVSSLLYWQAETLQDEHMIKIINDGRSRIKSMALIHELLYQSENLAKVEMNEYINSLIDFLEKIYNQTKRVTVIKSIETVLVDIDVTIPLGLIITELISNAFKYAFPNDATGIIEISLFEKRKHLYEIQIRDNGIGMTEELLHDVNRKSMGLELVKILVKQIKGQLVYQRNNGASFGVSFSNIPSNQRLKVTVCPPAF
jgi:two-component sensor histidine kinase